MTEQQSQTVNYSVDLQLRVLRLVKKEYHSNTWTEKFSSEVRETKSKLIYDIEAFLLKPTVTFEPLTRTFKPEDELTRIEIAQQVDLRFTQFRQEPNEEE